MIWRGEGERKERVERGREGEMIEKLEGIEVEGTKNFI